MGPLFSDAEVLLKVGWSIVKSSFTWKYEGRGFRKSGLKRGMVLGHTFIEIWRERFHKKWSLTRDGLSSGIRLHSNPYFALHSLPPPPNPVLFTSPSVKSVEGFEGNSLRIVLTDPSSLFLSVLYNRISMSMSTCRVESDSMQETACLLHLAKMTVNGGRGI